MNMQPTAQASGKSSQHAVRSEGAIAMFATLLPLLLATVLGVVGQLLLKQGMLQGGAVQLELATIPAVIWRMATSPYVVGGLLV